jgi:hypothetical protein
VSAFRLRVRLDPGADHRAALAAYPAAPLRPDFAVATSGLLAIDLGSMAIAYRRGRRVTLPAGSDDPAVWLADYLGGFLGRLAGAVLTVRPGRPATAHLLDVPAALIFIQAGRRLVIRFVDAQGEAARAVVAATDARATVADALDAFQVSLLAVNPRLAEHPEVVALARQRAALGG